MQITLPNGWVPRPKQETLWTYLRGGGKRAAVCWHRRFGKDDVSLHFTAIAAHERVGSYWHLLPEQAQARKAIWTQVNPHTGKRRIDEAFPMALRKRTNDQEMFIEFLNGSTWQIAGSDNYNSLVGSSPCGIVFSEYALANPASWAYLRPILRENGGWAVFISTPRGKNHFYHMVELAKREPGWFAETLTVEDTKLLDPMQLEADLRELQAEHGETYGRSIWMQENYCSFDAAVPGSFYADSLDRLQLNGSIMDFDADPASLVYTGWDLGRTDDTAIWFYQFRGDTIDILDYWADSGCEINNPDDPKKSLVHVLLDKSRTFGYRYARHWLPHDARPRKLGMGGKSILQQFHDARLVHPGLGSFAIVPKLDVQEGIQAARKTFQRTRFHKTRCELGLQVLRHYHRDWDPDKKIYTDHPVHDWCLAGETEILTRYGTHRIMDLPPTGEVMTICGWKPYNSPRITRRDAPLVEVTFSDGRSVKCTPDHLFLTADGWIFAEHLTPTTPILSSLTRSRSISMAASTAYGRVIATCREAARSCIAMCGGKRMAPSLAGVTSTIETEIPSITHSAILSVFRQASISRRPGNGQREERSDSISQAMLKRELRNGTDQKKGGSGTDDICNACSPGPSGNASPKLAPFVVRRFKAWIERVGIAKFIAVRNAKWLHIERVVRRTDTADVWCLTVPDVEHFSLSNGAIVHNSSHGADAFRYLALSWKAERPKEADVTPEERTARLLRNNPSGQTFNAMKQQHFRRKRALRDGAMT